MGEQALDLRSGLAVLRRQRQVIGSIALLGAVLGGLVPLMRPPAYSSTAEVLLPTRADTTDAQSSDTDTQVRIASSETVLGPAGRRAAPGVPFAELAHRVKVSAPSEQTIMFTASAATAAKARALASAAAAAELQYVAKAEAAESNGEVISLLTRLESAVTSLHQQITTAPTQVQDSPQFTSLGAEVATVSGQLQSLSAAAQPLNGSASVIQPASAATRPGFVRTWIVPSGTGLLGGLLLSCALVLLLARRDGRLRSRDQLAAAIGSPVLASFSGRGARSTGGWHHLLSDYDPSPVDAWTLRQLLREIPGQPDGRRRITFISPPGDGRAVALGALVASYAASTGTTTELAFGDVSSNSGLASALLRVNGGELRPRLTITRDAPATGADLVVIATAVGGSELDPLSGPAIVSVSAGAASRERLARTAIAGEEAGAHIIGIAVVDPDTEDRSSGRLFGRGGDDGHAADLPTRLPGLTVAREQRQEVQR